MVTESEYNSLMDEANNLNVNDSEGELEIKFVQMQEQIDAINTEIANIKKALKEGEIVIPESEPPMEDGSKEHPIVAYAGMTYYKDKYYLDTTDGNTYFCFRDSDTEPGTGIQMYYVPSQLVGLYFTLVQDSTDEG